MRECGPTAKLVVCVGPRSMCDRRLLWCSVGVSLMYIWWWVRIMQACQTNSVSCGDKGWT